MTTKSNQTTTSLTKMATQPLDHAVSSDPNTKAKCPLALLDIIAAGERILSANFVQVTHCQTFFDILATLHERLGVEFPQGQHTLSACALAVTYQKIAEDGVPEDCTRQAENDRELSQLWKTVSSEGPQFETMGLHEMSFAYSNLPKIKFEILRPGFINFKPPTTRTVASRTFLNNLQKCLAQRNRDSPLPLNVLHGIAASCVSELIDDLRERKRVGDLLEDKVKKQMENHVEAQKLMDRSIQSHADNVEYWKKRAYEAESDAIQSLLRRPECEPWQKLLDEVHEQREQEKDLFKKTEQVHQKELRNLGQQHSELQDLANGFVSTSKGVETVTKTSSGHNTADSSTVQDGSHEDKTTGDNGFKLIPDQDERKHNISRKQNPPKQLVLSSTEAEMQAAREKAKAALQAEQKRKQATTQPIQNKPDSNTDNNADHANDLHKEPDATAGQTDSQVKLQKAKAAAQASLKRDRDGIEDSFKATSHNEQNSPDSSNISSKPDVKAESTDDESGSKRKRDNPDDVDESMAKTQKLNGGDGNTA